MRYLLILSLLCLLFLPLSMAQGRMAAEPGLPLNFSWTSTGTETGAQHAMAVGLDGDFNGDGWNDLFVGAPKAQDTVYREGVVYVHHGSLTGLADIPHWTMGSGQQGANFGGAVASAGDVNGDHADDLLVGASGYSEKDNKYTEQGAVYLYQGGMSGLGDTPVWSYYGGQQGAWMGTAVSSAGDVNGDGYADVLVGASRYSQTYNNEGAAFVFYGSVDGLGETPDWTAYGGQATATFGGAVAAAGDLDQDGYDDIVVGAPNYDYGPLTNCGAAYVYLGSESGLLSTPEWVFYGDTAEAKLGSAVAGAGDVNQDGFADILVGAPNYSSLDFSYEGSAYLFLGSYTGLLDVPDWSYFGGQYLANFGASLAAAGDLNQDGYADVAIGAYRFTDDHSMEGRTFVFYGNVDGLRTTPSWWADGNKAEATFGQVLGGNGDLNRDGYLDLVVGAPGYRIGETIVGRAFVFFGVPDAVVPSIYNLMYLPMIMQSP